MIGSKLGHFEITAHLGSGGMGDVYEAVDSKLGRNVALKFLPEEFTHDADRAARFQREARVLASLNHSGIAVVHGLEDAGGRTLLVMELVPGETLADRIRSGPVPVDEALAIALQIADALEYAHEKGIVHRDLKPANVKITPEGKVKLLDFGLAKALEPDSAQTNLSNSPTLSLAATNPGVILGTAAYMAPEQARGRSVDKRADIWAFGVVLYELLTGKQLFKGEDLTETLAAVVKERPALDDVPARIRPLLRRCLEKDPAKRLRDISGFKLLMEESPATPVMRKSALAWLGWGVAVTMAVALSAVLWITFPSNTVEPVPAQFQITNVPDVIEYAAVSPDGRQVLLLVQDRSRSNTLWIRPMNSLTARQLPGTAMDGVPFWLPDSRFVVFSTKQRLKKVDVLGGLPTTLCNLPARVVAVGGTSNSEGTILFGTDGNGIVRVQNSGGTCSTVTAVEGSGTHVFPAFLADGRHFLYVRRSGSQTQASLFVGSIDAKPGEQETNKPLISPVGNTGAGGTSVAAMYIPGDARAPGHVLFVRENTLWAQAFDEKTLQLRDEPSSVIEGVGIFSASRMGLASLTGSQTNAQLTWVDEKGDPKTTPAEVAEYATIALSPNADLAAVVKVQAGIRGNRDIWLLDLLSGREEPFTSTGNVGNNRPLWSRDGKQIVYSISSETATTIYRRPADRSSDAEVLFKSPGPGYVSSWSPDGRFLLRMVRDVKTTNADITLISLDSKTESPLIATSNVEVNGRFSPDGKWIAYFSDESRRNEVYVRSFAVGPSSEPPRLGPPLLVSKGGPPGILGGGIGPFWRSDSKALSYPSPSGWMTVEITRSNSSNSFADPKPFLNLPSQSIFDISSDFQRALLARPLDQNASTPVTVILNWQQMLKK